MRILIADANAVSRFMLETLLRGFGHRLFIARNGPDAIRIAKDRAPIDLALVDAKLPGLPGAEVCRALRADRGEPSPYLVALVDVGQRADIDVALSAGADDYLHKPFEAVEVMAKLGIARRVLALATRLCAASVELAQRERHDLLTGALARATTLDRLEELMGSSEAAPLGVMLVDLDGFSGVNALHGASAGDAALRDTAARVGPTLPSGAFVGRIGADELLVLLPATSPPQVAQIANRARHAIAAAPFRVPGGAAPRDVDLTASVAWLDAPGADGDLDGILRSLDAAMAEAKRLGGDRTVCAGAREEAAERAA